MDLQDYLVKDLLVVAHTSELEAKDFYYGLCRDADTSFMLQRLEFLAREEENHQRVIESIFNDLFPGEEITTIEESPIPLPALALDESLSLDELLDKAMEAELAAQKFYKSLADRFGDRPDVRKVLDYLADMETEHYNILESEKKHHKNTLSFKDKVLSR